MKISRGYLVLAVLLAALPRAALAQFETATVLGTVKDGSGAFIVGSKVTLENAKTGVLSTAQSNDSGNFDFIAVQIGTYRLKAESPGFKIGLSPDFRVAVSARQRVDLTLEVGDVTQTVAVKDTIAMQKVGHVVDVVRRCTRRCAAGADHGLGRERVSQAQAGCPVVTVRMHQGAAEISYIHFNRAGGENLLAYNPPSVITININNPNPQTSPTCATDVANSNCFRPTALGYSIAPGGVAPGVAERVGVKRVHRNNRICLVEVVVDIPISTRPILACTRISRCGRRSASWNSARSFST
jgi:Carboxypeptidase regulatory-like domain